TKSGRPADPRPSGQGGVWNFTYLARPRRGRPTKSRFIMAQSAEIPILQNHPPQEWLSLVKAVSPEARISILDAMPGEDWFFILEVLMVRDRELDHGAMDSYAKDQNPEKAPIGVRDRHDSRMLGALTRVWRKYGCDGYNRCLFGHEPLP